MPRPVNYQQVDERLGKFWKDHEDGRVLTELVSPPESTNYIVKALVWRDGDGEMPDATGYAEEHLDPSHPVNATWPLENCETSAIGRALANLGYAPKGARPSKTEVEKKERVSAPKADDGGGAGDDAGTSQTPTPPGTPRVYAVDAAQCTHRYPSGNWLPWDDADRCPKCGMPKVVAMEGTTADLGGYG